MCNFNTETTDYYSCNGQHVHEVIGSTIQAEECEDCHNHRFATVSGEAIEAQGSHYHNITFRTDSHNRHIHEFCGPSSLAIPIGDGRHVHFVKACTTSAEDGHAHEFRVATLINDAVEEC